MPIRRCLLLCLVLTWTAPASRASAPADLRDDALRAMRKAAAFYREKAAFRGGYAFYYSPDLARRWGEGEVSADTIVVQPPGTPTVGMAFLRAYEATGDTYYLDAAREAAEALVYGQLQSGGWTQNIHFGPARRQGRYRHGKGGTWNVSSLDDDQTQSALRFLALADRALGFRHEAIHEAVKYGLAALLKAQFPNGGFPQGWTGPVEAKPVLKARFPEYDWKTEGKVKNYWDCYTLNDNLAGAVADTLITAHRVYGDERYKAALEKLGGFLVLAQMPDPQPGWCQQYNHDMVPIWARKFEPPAITGAESQDAMETLIRIARYTGRKEFLPPVARALEYFRRSALPDGMLARFYELRTNRPLYMDGEYRLTYDDSAAPAHYAWKVRSRLDSIAAQLREADKDSATRPAASSQPPAQTVRKIIADLDDQGRWISTYAGEKLTGAPAFQRGFRYISSALFARNLSVLSDCIASRGGG